MATILTGPPARSLSFRCGNVSSTRISSSGTVHCAPPKADGAQAIAATTKTPARCSLRSISPRPDCRFILGLFPSRAGDWHGRRNSPHRLIPVDYSSSHAQHKNAGGINSELDADTRTELGEHEMTERREQDTEAKYFQRLLPTKDHRLCCGRAEKTCVWRHEGSDQ